MTNGDKKTIATKVVVETVEFDFGVFIRSFFPEFNYVEYRLA